MKMANAGAVSANHAGLTATDAASANRTLPTWTAPRAHVPQLRLRITKASSPKTLRAAPTDKPIAKSMLTSQPQQTLQPTNAQKIDHALRAAARAMVPPNPSRLRVKARPRTAL